MPDSACSQVGDMNYDELAYFVMMSLVALSILTVAVGFTVRVFLGPVLRDVAERLANRPTGEAAATTRHLSQLDERLANLETALERIEAAQDFERRLGSAEAPKSEKV